MANQTLPVPFYKSNQCRTHEIPSLAKDSECAIGFRNWLTSKTAGSKSETQADQIISRALKFLKSVSNDDLSYEEVTENTVIDFYLGSGCNISEFIENLETSMEMGHSGQLGYINALGDLIDYRKYQGVTPQVLQNFSVVEMLIRRARRCISKKMRIQWNSELDIDSLEKRGHWARIEDLQAIIPFHLDHYKKTLDCCRKYPSSVPSKDLTFATRFVAVYLFLRVKGTRPMTYQFLTVDMFEEAKQSDGFVDQKKFKTADNYSFDSFNLDSTAVKVIQQYVKHVRPLLGPKCNSLLVNRNGMQFSKLTECMGKLVFEAIGKYIHPTRYRQIIETESNQILTTEERQWITEDQKHSSRVAKVHYRKRRSRDVALRGNDCLKRLRGEAGERTDAILREAFNQSSTDGEDDDIFLTQNRFHSPERRKDGIQDTNLFTLPETDNQLKEEHAKSYVRHRVTFTTTEDMDLAKGMQKYGYGEWTKMLKDPTFKFHCTRTPDKFKKRADSKTFKCKFDKFDVQ